MPKHQNSHRKVFRCVRASVQCIQPLNRPIIKPISASICKNIQISRTPDPIPNPKCYERKQRDGDCVVSTNANVIISFITDQILEKKQTIRLAMAYKHLNALCVFVLFFCFFDGRRFVESGVGRREAAPLKSDEERLNDAADKYEKKVAQAIDAVTKNESAWLNHLKNFTGW